jgi:flagellar motility protein MotE (MotC chaperone)
MKHKAEQLVEQLAEIEERLKQLNTLLTERISELHEVKGAMQARHAFIHYRGIVWEAQRTLNKIAKEHEEVVNPYKGMHKPKTEK